MWWKNVGSWHFERNAVFQTESHNYKSTVENFKVILSCTSRRKKKTSRFWNSAIISSGDWMDLPKYVSSVFTDDSLTFLMHKHSRRLLQLFSRGKKWLSLCQLLTPRILPFFNRKKVHDLKKNTPTFHFFPSFLKVCSFEGHLHDTHVVAAFWRGCYHSNGNFCNTNSLLELHPVWFLDIISRTAVGCSLSSLTSALNWTGLPSATRAALCEPNRLSILTELLSHVTDVSLQWHEYAFPLFLSRLKSWWCWRWAPSQRPLKASQQSLCK